MGNVHSEFNTHMCSARYVRRRLVKKRLSDLWFLYRAVIILLLVTDDFLAYTYKCQVYKSNQEILGKFFLTMF